jgi:PAS domain S-box-containing protein
MASPPDIRAPTPPPHPARGVADFSITIDGVVVSWNPAAEKLLGYATDEIVGCPITVLLLPDRAVEASQLLDRVTRSQKPEILPGGLRTREGGTTSVSLIVSPLWWDAEGRVTALSIAARSPDDEREGSHAKLLQTRARDRNQVVADASRLFGESRFDLEELLDKLCEVVVTSVADGAYVQRLSEDGSRVESLAARHRDPGQAAVLREMAALSPSASEGLAGRVLRSGKPIMVPRVDPDEVRRAVAPDYRGHVDRLSIGSCIMVPMRLRQSSVGVLGLLRSRESAPFGREDLELAQDLAGRAGAALETARLFRAAEREARRLEAVFAGAVDGILVSDRNGRVDRANDRASRIFGVPREELYIPLWEYAERFKLRSADDERPCPLGVRALQGETVEPLERIMTTPAGEDRYLRTGAAPLRDPEGRIEGAVIVVGDVTAQKRAEDQILELNRTLEERVEARTAELRAALGELGAFAYTVAHDLRAPLRAIHAFGDVLAEDYRDRPFDLEGREVLDRIREAARRMDALIQGILDYSRIGRSEEVLQPVDLEAVVAEATAALALDFERRRARLVIRRPLPRVRASRLLLLQVITNLLSNAAKFVAARARPEVDLNAVREGACVRISVRDNGIGIEPEHHDRIFGVFERLNRSEAYPGTGVGLAIVKRAVEKMGGQVGLDSAPGCGSTFWVLLQAAEA